MALTRREMVRPGAATSAVVDEVRSRSYPLHDSRDLDPLPQYERFGNYVPTVLPQRYDALVYIDESHALHPLHIEVAPERDLPETYPTGV